MLFSRPDVARKKIIASLSNDAGPVRPWIMHHQSTEGSRTMTTQSSQTIGKAMPTEADPASISKPVLWLGRVLSGLVIVFLLFDGAIKLVPWPVVTETMDRIGYGSSESLARSLGAITIACTVLYAIPPTSIVGAILLTGYLGGAMASHLRIGSPLFSHILFGFYLGLMLWGGLWLRDKSLRSLIPFRR
jgi:DoxX-like family